MTREEKKELRGDLFRHLDGLVTAPTAFSLWKHGVLRHLLSKNSVTVKALAKELKANEGYLNVGLRVLASQGWLGYKVEDETVTVQCNAKSAVAFNMIGHYNNVVQLLQASGKFHPRKFEKKPFLLLNKIFSEYKALVEDKSAREPLEAEIHFQILKHIEGMIVGPTVVALGMGGMFHKYFMEASFKPEEFHKDSESFEKLLDIFVYLDWFNKKKDTYRFTEKGLFYARRASAYGVTVSYLPLFRHLDDLMFGDSEKLWTIASGAKELHVDREMNVWGSGGAHSSYFKKIDEIIINLFNRPIEEQPKGIVDMGCGNGAFLIHLFDVIERQTLRGTMLEDHPLFLVGADYNQAALNVTKANIIQADIWAKVIFGDIGRPDLLAKDLKEDYGIELKDLLNVRTFLDHNRIWSNPKKPKGETRQSKSTGAFASKGRYLSGKVVEENLLEHLTKWSPFVKKFGLLTIELHTISPALTARNLGLTAATAYDATHGFSNQYIVEIEVLHKIAAEAGLVSVPEYFAKFPNSDLATVSLNLFRSK